MSKKMDFNKNSLVSNFYRVVKFMDNITNKENYCLNDLSANDKPNQEDFIQTHYAVG